MNKKIHFYSEGHKLSGVLYVPAEQKKGQKRPGIVICHGYTGIKELILPEIAEVFSQAGYVCLIFDYRGFGESEGQRWRLVPLEQVEDIRNALTFLSLQEGVDENLLGLYGTSYGSSNVSYVAGIDERAKCTVGTVGFGDGRRWLRGLFRKWEWEEFLKKLDEDRKRRVLEGKSHYVDPLDIMMPDPQTKAFFEEVTKAFPQWKCQIPLETAEYTLEYKPESVVHHISPRAIMWIHAGGDMLVSADESLSMYEKAREPKRLVILDGVAHFEVYTGEPFNRVMEEALGWYKQHLPLP